MTDLTDRLLRHADLHADQPWADDEQMQFARDLRDAAALLVSKALTDTQKPVALVQATAPREIWLQVSDDAEHSAEPFPTDNDGITWAKDAALMCAVPYVRADLAQAQPAPAQRLSDVLLDIDSVEHMQGGANGPTIRLRGFINAQTVPTAPQPPIDNAFVAEGCEQFSPPADIVNPISQQEPVAYRHSKTGQLYDSEEEVPLADGDEWAEPLYAAPVAQQEPSAWRQWSTKQHDWDYQTNRGDLRPDALAEPLFVAAAQPGAIEQALQKIADFGQEQEQKPVAWMDSYCAVIPSSMRRRMIADGGKSELIALRYSNPLYATPPAQPADSLTPSNKE